MPDPKTTAQIVSLADGHRRLRSAPKIPPGALTIANALADFGIRVPTHFTHFHLRRRRCGTEVWVNDYGKADGGFNLSGLLGVWPQGFKAARQWAAAWGSANGHDLRECHDDR